MRTREKSSAMRRPSSLSIERVVALLRVRTLLPGVVLFEVAEGVLEGVTRGEEKEEV
jgi:hypothetical protein